MLARWRLAVLVSVVVSSVGKIVFTWVKGLYQGIPCNPKVSPRSTGEWTVYPNRFSRLDRDPDLVLYPRSICFVGKPPGREGRRFPDAEVCTINRNQTMASVVFFVPVFPVDLAA
jgi:hypothetical protein